MQVRGSIPFSDLRKHLKTLEGVLQFLPNLGPNLA